MKKITLILITLFAFIYANAQYTVPRGLPYHDTRWIENKGIAGATYLFDSIVMFRNIADTQMKPLYPALAFILDFDGDSTFWVYDTKRWKKLTGSGGGTGTNNTNLGSAYRWLNETSQGIKTVNKGFGIGLDSLTTGEIRITADTSKLPTRYTIDSLGNANGRFAIEDNTGIQARAIDMSAFPFEMTNVDEFSIQTDLVSSLSNSFDIFAGETILTSHDNSVNETTQIFQEPPFIELRYTPTSGSATASLRVEDNTVTAAATSFKLNGIPSTTTANILYYNSTTKEVTYGSAGGGGTVASFSAGNLSPLFTTSVATSTSTPALTFALTNATGGTVFGNNTGSSAAPAYTAVPVLGIAGTTKGTLGLAGNTSGVVTVQPAAAAGTWSLTLPTTGGTSGYFLQTNGSGVTTWAAASGGTTLTRQAITSGSSGTVTGGNYIVTIDPAATLASYTLTLPASPTDLDVVEVDFGGTLTSGMIVTALTVSPNSGQTILDNVPPTSAMTDNTLFYRYRTSNTTWYRFKP